MTAARNPETEKAPPILESRQNGWRSLWKNDGTDYPALLQSFLAGEITGEEFKRDYSTSVTQVDALGRRFIFKHYYKWEPRPEKRLWHRLAGTFYSRIFRLTNQAIRNGCQNVQDIFLVAEQFEKHDAKEVWLIAEFIPGEQLNKGDPMARREQIFLAIAELHHCGLASNDLNISNMIVTGDDQIKVIDISINTFLSICQIKDIILLHRKFGGEPPFREIFLPTYRRRFLYWAVRCRNCFRLTLRRLQGTHDKNGRKIAKH